jgi:hypothetical protein
LSLSLSLTESATGAQLRARRNHRGSSGTRRPSHLAIFPPRLSLTSTQGRGPRGPPRRGPARTRARASVRCGSSDSAPPPRAGGARTLARLRQGDATLGRTLGDTRTRTTTRTHALRARETSLLRRRRRRRRRWRWRWWRRLSLSLSFSLSLPGSVRPPI